MKDKARRSKRRRRVVLQGDRRSRRRKKKNRRSGGSGGGNMQVKKKCSVNHSPNISMNGRGNKGGGCRGPSGGLLAGAAAQSRRSASAAKTKAEELWCRGRNL